MQVYKSVFVDKSKTPYRYILLTLNFKSVPLSLSAHASSGIRGWV